MCVCVCCRDVNYTTGTVPTSTSPRPQREKSLKKPVGWLEAAANSAMKIRAKNVKAKIQKDFNKVKAKVGKKVKRSNVTAIKIESKRIVIPLQSLNVEKSMDEKINLDKIIKQLSHYSVNNRAIALNDLKIIMENSIYAESYIAIIISKTMELMFDEDTNIRKSCTEVLTIIFTKFNSSCFEAVASMIISYICSGLTNISKLIRKDTLNVLLCLVNHHPILLVMQFEKIVEHVLALVNISNQSNTAIGINKSSQGSVLKIAAAEANMNKGNKDKMAKSTLLVSVLKVLVSLLSNTIGASMIKINHNVNNVEFALKDNCNSIILLNSKKSISKFIEYKKKGIVKTFASNDMKVGHEFSNTLPCHLADNLCGRLNAIWGGLTASQGSIVSLDILDVLTEITSLAMVLGNKFLVGNLCSYKALVNSMIKLFPYHSYEAGIAAPGSSQEKLGLFQIEILNLSICEIVYVTSIHDTTEINKFMVNLIRKLVDQQSKKRQNIGDETITLHINHSNSISTVIPKLFGTFQTMITLTYSMHDQITVNTADKNEIFLIILQSCNELTKIITTSMIKAEQEARSIIIAVVKYISNIIMNILWKFDDLQYVNEIVNLIATMIITLLSLIADCPDELGFLKDNFISTVLAMVQRNVNPVFSDAYTKLVFKTHKEFYLKCDNINIRYRMLDILYYSCFNDSKLFFIAAKLVIKCAVSSKVTSEERQYLLRILFERRYELGLNDYIQLLFLSLQYYIKSVNNTIVGKDTTKNAIKNHKILIENADILHWYGNDVTNAILWCSSPELSSINLLKLVKPLLEEFTVSNDKSSIENYLSTLVIISFVTRLFSTTSVSCTDSTETVLVDDTLRLLCSHVYGYITNDLIFPANTLISSEHKDLFKLYNPINSCLHFKFVDHYPMIKMVLQDIDDKWITYTQFNKEKILKILYNIYISSDIIASVSRTDINLFVTSIIQKTSNDDNINSLIVALKIFC